MEINRKEVLRYLGYRGHEADAAVAQRIEQAIQQVEGFTPKTVHTRVPCQVQDAETVELAGIPIKSRNLARHLKSCRGAYLIGATLGLPADLLLQRYGVQDMGNAVILQAACAAGIEWVCDTLEQTLLTEARSEGLYLRPRFSPGYGDFSIEHQRDMIRLLDAPRRIGLTVTDSLMMVPTKSVTAIIGLTLDGEGCHTVKCAACSQKDCPFRKV